MYNLFSLMYVKTLFVTNPLTLWYNSELIPSSLDSFILFLISVDDTLPIAFLSSSKVIWFFGKFGLDKRSNSKPLL